MLTFRSSSSRLFLWAAVNRFLGFKAKINRASPNNNNLTHTLLTAAQKI